MAHTFDTALAQDQRSLIQAAVVALLAPLKRSAGGYLLDVKPIGIVVRTYSDDPGVAQFFASMSRAPAIAVATGTRPFTSGGVGGKQAIGELEVLVYFASHHSRDMQSRMAQDVVAQASNTADPGLGTMMEHALELLHGRYPVPEADGKMTIHQLQIRREEELATIENVTLWMQTYSVQTFHRGRGNQQFRTPQQLLESIGWRVSTNPDEAVPPDAATDSTSLDHDNDLT